MNWCRELKPSLVWSYGVEFGSANLKTTRYDMCGSLNFDDKDKISLQKIDKISGPSKDARDQALGWGIRV